MLTCMSTHNNIAKDTTPARENLLSARSLRYLHEIDVHGGVRAAADAFCINGSVISLQVAQLERDHGVVLLERRGRLGIGVGEGVVENLLATLLEGFQLAVS
jgi:DNA-binding transcriptional LysR family regulator